MKIRNLDPKLLPELWARAFREMAAWAQQNPDKGGLLQNSWQHAAMESEEFRAFAKHAVQRIREVCGPLRISPTDDAFLRGVGLGTMIGYRIRENQEEE